ncbi:MAG TPA: hypothetical protein VE621_01980, partial [Bryobacteraceae bacterium]|nr:hypothetical protein [Bryobacteraceae bacterium]
MRKLTFGFVLACCTLLGGNSPAERAMQQAQSKIAKSPDKAEGHRALAMALARRARETANTQFYDQALKALEDADKLDPGRLENKKVKCWVLLGKHEFAAALELAREINKKNPDDVMTYGLLADA